MTLLRRIECFLFLEIPVVLFSTTDSCYGVVLGHVANINYMRGIPLRVVLESCLSGRLSYIPIIRVVEYTEARWQWFPETICCFEAIKRIVLFGGFRALPTKSIKLSHLKF